MTNTPTTEGEIDFHVKGVDGPCKTWYKIFGTLTSTSIPLICLHGGPGVPHNYLLSLSTITANTSVPMILYDQLGCGKSTHLPSQSNPEEFWRPQLFLEELENLIKDLKISRYNLLGQSWGGMLGSMHAILKPSGLNRLIIANSPASMKLWVKAAEKLKKELPEDVQEVLEKCERDGTTGSEEYETAMGWALQTWTVVDELHKIEVPTLLINGKYDEAQDEVVDPFFKNIKTVKWERFEDSSHMPHLEEADRFMEVVQSFIAE
ncbi:related to proline iminopeptidase [Rhynchosporium secalis]|uniref:Related to proline iminopeptidase n=1 Tax=Rhynchosporium secalis TaxID=38038 RepID=A0A1E1MB26_RHYSE|nr:related to proline iminopeptidase [Rhynchosporium secalis]